MPYAVAAAGIGAAGSIASGIMGADASKAASKAQMQAAQLASGTELSMFNKTEGDLKPYMESGTNALSQLQKILGIGPGGQGATNPMLAMLGIGPNGQSSGGIDPRTFQASPGYQFGMQQGEQAVTNANAAQGIGGNALKALQDYGQGQANQNWQQYLGNVSGAYSNLTGQLGGLVGVGEGAAAKVGSAAMGVGSEIGGNQIGAGNAQAGGIIGGANALAGGLGGAGNAAMMYAMMNQGGGYGGGGGGGGGGVVTQPGMGTLDYSQNALGAMNYGYNPIAPYAGGLAGNTIMSSYG